MLPVSLAATHTDTETNKHSSVLPVSLAAIPTDKQTFFSAASFTCCYTQRQTLKQAFFSAASFSFCSNTLRQTFFKHTAYCSTLSTPATVVLVVVPLQWLLGGENLFADQETGGENLFADQETGLTPCEH